MNFARLASRVAIGGTTAALAAASLVGATSTSASAAPVHTTYSCVNPLLTFAGDVSVDIALLPSTAPAGFPVPAGLLSFNSSFTVDNATATGLGTLQVTGAKSDDFAATFGDTVAKAPVVWNAPQPPGPTTTSFNGKGANAAFVLPKAGTYTVSMPKAFTVIATRADGSTAATALCTQANPNPLGTITLSKQKATVKAKAPKSAKKGAVVTVKGKVTNEFVKTGGPEATGKLIVKDGKKKVGKGKLKNGKYTIKVKGLGVGSHKLTVQY
ncbi:MAG TPA: DUF6801 domain-containing protein, partial [Nocardioides sp.]|uniref:DUF6801 domain-containing protein n=1 Tax=Nocardioides sp. TaxID=35761 RepID=UPI002E2EE8C8